MNSKYDILLGELRTADKLTIDGQNVVTDPNYVHTDNNFTDELKNKYNNYESGLGDKENLSNKQNSLDSDGTGSKYPTVDCINKEFSNRPVGGAIAAGWVYLNNATSTVDANYKTLSYSGEPTSTIITTTANNGTTLIGKWLYPDAIAVTAIPFGVWSIFANRMVNNASNETYVKISIFVYHTDGTTTDIFTFNGDDINDVTMTDKYYEKVVSELAVVATDRLGIRLELVTTRLGNTTLSLAIGDGKAMRFTTPLPARHNTLRDLDGDPNHLHITNLEKNGGLNTGITASPIDPSINLSTVNKIGTTVSNIFSGGSYGVTYTNTMLRYESISSFNSASVLSNTITDATIYINQSCIFATSTIVNSVTTNVGNSGNVSVYSFNMSTRLFTLLQTFSGLNSGINTLTFTTPIRISDNTATFVTNVRWLNRGIPASYTITTSNPTTNVANNVELGYTVNYSIPSTYSSINTITSNVNNLIIGANNLKYVKLYGENTSDRTNSKVTIAAGWSLINNDYKCNANAGVLQINNRYWYDKRYLISTINLGADTYLMMPVTGGTQGRVALQ